MHNKKEKMERMTMDPYILDASDSTKSFSVADREDNPIGDPLSPPAESGGEGENNLKKAFLFLIRGDWKSAEEYCEKELKRNPDSADAYLGKLMAELHVSKEEHLSECEVPFDQSENYVGIRRSGNRDVIVRVDGYLRQIVERQKERLYTEAKRIMDSAKKKEDYQRAEALFEKIASYKDALKRQMVCQEIIVNWGKKKSSKNWKNIIMIVLIATVVTGVVIASIQLAPFMRKTKIEEENGLSDFDLSFLKLENNSQNMIYSPLSIKIGLSMLSEGSDGDTKAQIDNVIGNYRVKKYINNEHLSFANCLFVRDKYRKVQDDYIATLLEKYNADVIYDSFDSAERLNRWIDKQTLGQIKELFDDETIANQNYVIGNALAIDMYWGDQLVYMQRKDADLDGIEYHNVSFLHEKYTDTIDKYSTMTFCDQQDVSSAQIGASINKYNIIDEIGEDKIRKTVKIEYEKWLQSNEGKGIPESGLPDDPDEYIDNYIEEIKSNYKKVYISTTISIYNDNDIKAFSKDLKQYGDTKLQYIAIMPKEMALSKYIKTVKASKINEIISHLKELKNENFKDGVVTRITGHVPFFKYQKTLTLSKDLKAMGITDVFDKEKANLSGLTSQSQAFIGFFAHSTTIEFSNDGIKAATSSVDGYCDGGGLFDYLWDVPIEVIDMTFDKPFMYIIRDKESGEVWFVGSVYTVGER